MPGPKLRRRGRRSPRAQARVLHRGDAPGRRRKTLRRTCRRIPAQGPPTGWIRWTRPPRGSPGPTASGCIQFGVLAFGIVALISGVMLIISGIVPTDRPRHRTIAF